MRYGIDPHLGGFINDRSVGYWSNFCVSAGFSTLQLGLDFRPLSTGLPTVFDRALILTLKSARRRGLKIQVSVEPLYSRLDSPRLQQREEAVAFIRGTVGFLQKNISPSLILLSPGKASDDPDGGRVERLADSFRRIRDHYPFIRLGIKLGRKNEPLVSPAAVAEMVKRTRELEAAVEVGWLFAIFGGVAEKVEGMIGLLEPHLVQLHWNNLSFSRPGRPGPLNAGDLRESHYYFLLSRLPRRREIGHLLDYRDRDTRSYLNDRMTLQGLDFRLERG